MRIVPPHPHHLWAIPSRKYPRVYTRVSPVVTQDRSLANLPTLDSPRESSENLRRLVPFRSIRPFVRSFVRSFGRGYSSTSPAPKSNIHSTFSLHTQDTPTPTPTHIQGQGYNAKAQPEERVQSSHRRHTSPPKPKKEKKRTNRNDDILPQKNHREIIRHDWAE